VNVLLSDSSSGNNSETIQENPIKLNVFALFIPFQKFNQEITFPFFTLLTPLGV